MDDEIRWTGTDPGLMFDGGVVHVPGFDRAPPWWAWTVALAAALLADPIGRGAESFRRRRFGWRAPCGCYEAGAWYGTAQTRSSGDDGCAVHGMPARVLEIDLDGRIARMREREQRARDRMAELLRPLGRAPTFVEECEAAAIVRGEMG